MKKNAFTLIELLAVVVVMAILAVMVAPVVLDIINSSKEKTNENNAKTYLRAVELSINLLDLDGKSVRDGTYNIMSDGNICLGTYIKTTTGETCIDEDGIENNEILKVDIRNFPTEGNVTIKDSLVTEYHLIINKEIVTNIKTNDSEPILETPETYLATLEQALSKQNNINGTYEIMKNGSLCIGVYNKDNNTCLGEILKVESTIVKEGFVVINNNKIDKYSLTLDNQIVTNVEETKTSCFEYMDNYILGKDYTINSSVCSALFGETLNKNFDDSSAGDKVCNQGSQEYGDFIRLANYAGYDLKTLIGGNVVTIINENVDTVSITGYTCGGENWTEKDVVIPSKIDGKTVTKIGAFAFYPYAISGSPIQEKLINSVVIPNTVKIIEYSAFSSNKLTSITIPDSVLTIGRAAFYNNQLTSVNIGNGVTTIGRASFQNNVITNLKIGQNVKIIDSYAFQANKLVTITIPNSVETIDTYAFAYNNLNTIIIGSGITDVKYRAFYNGSYIDTETKIEYGPNDVKDVYINKDDMGLTSQDISNLFGITSPTIHWNSTGPSN